MLQARTKKVCGPAFTGGAQASKQQVRVEREGRSRLVVENALMDRLAEDRWSPYRIRQLRERGRVPRGEAAGSEELSSSRHSLPRAYLLARCLEFAFLCCRCVLASATWRVSWLSLLSKLLCLCE